MITDNSPAQETALTLKEAAAQLRCKDPRTLVSYVHRGFLKGSRIGKGWIFAQSAIDALIRDGIPAGAGERPKRGAPLKIARICRAKPH